MAEAPGNWGSGRTGYRVGALAAIFVTLTAAWSVGALAGQGVWYTSPVETTQLRELPVEQARALLASAEGSVWRVVQVRMPACAADVVSPTCAALEQDCREIGEFAHQHGAILSCSALYSRARVLLSSGGAKVDAKADTKASATK